MSDDCFEKGKPLTREGLFQLLTDEAYKVDAFDVSRGFEAIFFVIGEPRTYGADLTFRF